MIIMSNDAEYLKKVLRENLLVEFDDNCDAGTRQVTVKLRFKGDERPFAMDVIELPEGLR